VEEQLALEPPGDRVGLRSRACQAAPAAAEAPRAAAALLRRVESCRACRACLQLAAAESVQLAAADLRAQAGLLVMQTQTLGRMRSLLRTVQW
jgi:hypothetical protein